MENLEKLVKSGKVRHIGLSNESPWGILKFLNIAKENNLPKIVSVQNGYSLVNRIFDIANSEVSIRENCGLLAYSPLAGGRLSGKYIKKKKPKKIADILFGPKDFQDIILYGVKMQLKKYVKLAKKNNVSPSIFANAFVNSRPFVTSNIIGATSLDQLKENIDSIHFKMTNKMIEEIEDIHLSDPNPCF